MNYKAMKEERRRKKKEQIKEKWQMLSKKLPEITSLTESFGCEDGSSELPEPIRLWLEENNLLKILQVPIRRNCMTGSGHHRKCHWNVLNLVHEYGGHRIGGYCIAINKNARQFTSHSVWLTPEGKLVDVTSANYTDNQTHALFLPLIKEIRISWLAATFLFRWRDQEVDAFLAPELIDGLSSSLGYKVGSIDNGERAITIPQAHLLPRCLRREGCSTDDAEFKKELENGGFNLPSKWTGKLWDEIREDFMKSFPAPQPTFHKNSLKKKSSSSQSPR